jgi:hypothetical protein
VLPLVREIGGVLDGLGRSAEIVVVDDGSRDASFARLVEARPRSRGSGIVRLRRNYGQTAAMAAGIAEARGELLVTMDGDRQNDPRDIPKLLAALDDDIDVVHGWRVDRQDGLWNRRLPSMLANRLISVVTGTHLHDYGLHDAPHAHRRREGASRSTASYIASSPRWRRSLARGSSRSPCGIGAERGAVEVRHRAHRARRARSRDDQVPGRILHASVARVRRRRIVLALVGFGLESPSSATSGSCSASAWADAPSCSSRFARDRGVQFVSIGLVGEMVMRTYHESQAKPIFRVREVREARVGTRGEPIEHLH